MLLKNQVYHLVFCFYEPQMVYLRLIIKKTVMAQNKKLVGKKSPSSTPQKKIELGFLSKHLIHLDKNAFTKDIKE